MYLISMNSVGNLGGMIQEVRQSLPIGDLYEATAGLQETIESIDGELGPYNAITPHLDRTKDHAARAIALLVDASVSLAGYLDAVGYGGHAQPDVPAAASSRPTAETAAVGELTGPVLTRNEVMSQFVTWKMGKPVPSEAVALATVALSPHEEAVLAGLTRAYDESPPADYHHEIPGLNFALTAEQRAILHRIRADFERLVKQDGARGGLGPIDHNDTVIRAGICSGDEADSEWHVDNYSEAAVRYVLSFGQASTGFGKGTITRNDITNFGDLRPGITVGEGGQFIPENHGVGVISRFLANQGVHSMPPQVGWRVFFTVSIRLEGQP